MGFTILASIRQNLYGAQGSENFSNRFWANPTALLRRDNYLFLAYNKAIKLILPISGQV
jgi:hypothetical protein